MNNSPALLRSTLCLLLLWPGDGRKILLFQISHKVSFVLLRLKYGDMPTTTISDFRTYCLFYTVEELRKNILSYTIFYKKKSKIFETSLIIDPVSQILMSDQWFPGLWCQIWIKALKLCIITSLFLLDIQIYSTRKCVGSLRTFSWHLYIIFVIYLPELSYCIYKTD